MLLTLSSNSDRSFTEMTHYLLTNYLLSLLDSSIEVCNFHWAWTGAPFQALHLRVLTTHPVTSFQDCLE